MPSHIPVIFARNSSFVFHKCVNAAARAATMAITAKTGAEIPPIAVSNPVMAPLTCPIFATIDPHCIATMIAPIVESAIPTSGK